MLTSQHAFGLLVILLGLLCLWGQINSPTSKTRVIEPRVELPVQTGQERSPNPTGTPKTSSSSSGSSPVVSVLPESVPITSLLHLTQGAFDEKKRAPLNKHTIFGVVSDSETGDPIPEAVITCFKNRTSFGFQNPVMRQFTDRSGRYRLKLAAPRVCKLLVEAAGKARAMAWITPLGSPIVEQNFRLASADAAVTGVVVDVRGHSIEGALVAPAYPFSLPDFAGLASLPSRTERAGKFEISDLKPGPTNLAANATGFLPHFEKVDLVAGRISSVRIVLEDALTVRIRVVHERIPVPDTQVFCKVDSEFYAATSDERGYADLDLRPEAASLACEIHALGFLETSFRLDPRSPPTSVPMKRSPAVQGMIVSSAGRPVPQARIAGGQEFVLGDKEGRFSVTPNDFPFTHSKRPRFPHRGVPHQRRLGQ